LPVWIWRSRYGVEGRRFAVVTLTIIRQAILGLGLSDPRKTIWPLISLFCILCWQQKPLHRRLRPVSGVRGFRQIESSAT